MRAARAGRRCGSGSAASSSAGVGPVRFAEEALHGGQVLEEQLILQVDGVRGDHDAGVVLHGELQRGQQIGQRLAGAGAGFDHQVATRVERAADGGEHLDLLRPVLEARQDGLGGAAGGQHGAEGGEVERGGGDVGGLQRLGERGRADQAEVELGLREARRGELARERTLDGDGPVEGGADEVVLDVLEEVAQRPVGRGGGAGDLGQHLDGELFEPAHEGIEDVHRHLGVGDGAVLGGHGHGERGGDARQAVDGDLGQQQGRKLKGVVGAIAQGNALALEQGQVDLDRMADDRVVADEAGERGGGDLQGRGPAHVVPGNPGERGDLVGDRLGGPDEALPLVEDLAVAELHGADLDNLVGLRPQTGGLGVECDIDTPHEFRFRSRLVSAGLG